MQHKSFVLALRHAVELAHDQAGLLLAIKAPVLAQGLPLNIRAVHIGRQLDVLVLDRLAGTSPGAGQEHLPLPDRILVAIRRQQQRLASVPAAKGHRAAHNSHSLVQIRGAADLNDETALELVCSGCTWRGSQLLYLNLRLGWILGDYWVQSCGLIQLSPILTRLDISARELAAEGRRRRHGLG